MLVEIEELGESVEALVFELKLLQAKLSKLAEKGYVLKNNIFLTTEERDEATRLTYIVADFEQECHYTIECIEADDDD